MEFYKDKRKKRSDKFKNKLNKFGKYSRRHVRIILSVNDKKNKKKIYPFRHRGN